MLPIQEIFALFLLGGAVGTIGALVGIGGGLILVPVLIFLGLDPHVATGTSLAVVLFTGLSSALAYFRQKRVDWRTGLILELTTAPGGFLGAFLTTLASSKQMKIFFSLLMMFVAYKMWRGGLELGSFASKFKIRRRLVDSDGKIIEYDVDIAPAIALSFLAGLASGFFGIGGGVLKVPILMAAGAPVHVAVATSSFMIVITASSALLERASLGQIRYYYLIGLIPGTIIGAQIGARIAKRTRSRILRRGFALVLCAASIYMIARSL